KTVLFTVLPGQPVGFFSAWEVMQADVADRQISEHRGQIKRLSALQKLAISALIELNGLLEAVLPVIDVSDVAVQARHAHAVFISMEDRAGGLSQFEGAFVLPVINPAVQRAADGASVIDITTGLLKDRQRLLILLNGRFVFAGEVKNVSHGASTLR